MRILHIITGLNNGGAEGALYRLTTSDRRSGNQHFVVSLMGRGVYADRLEQAGHGVECLFMPRGRITFRGVLKLYRHIKTLHPDIIQTWLYHADLIGGLIARLAGNKTVVWGIRHSNVDAGKNKRLTFLTMKVCALLSSFIPTSIACCSERAVPLHQNIGYRADKFTVIPNGYAMDRVKPDLTARSRIRHELGIDDQTVVLGMVARYDPEKDHENLLQALSLLTQSLPAFTCLLTGNGMSLDNAELTTLIHDAGVQRSIRLLGPRDDIPSILNALDIHVLSSRSEAFPNVVAEAMACGTPCVSTDVGDARLIIGSTGWLVPHGDPAALAKAIMIALCERRANPRQWIARQERCREHILEKYDIEKMVLAYDKLWQHALSTTKPRIRRCQ